MSTKQTGGQRRTVTARCGYTVAGHPNEVDKLFKRHQKYCRSGICQDSNIPQFDTVAAKTNGWDGIGKNKHFISSYSASTLLQLDGVKYNASIKSEGHTLPSIENLSMDEMVTFIEAVKEEPKKEARKKKQKKPVVVVANK